MAAPLQFDPALKQLLLRRTGSPLGEELPVEAAADLVPVVARLRDPRRAVDGLRVVARAGDVVTARVSLAEIVPVRRDPNVLSLKASVRYAPSLGRSVPEINATTAALARAAPPTGVTGAGTVIALLDWGLDFVHSNLRNADGSSRVLWLWDQRGGRHPSSPEPFGEGREWSQADINAALAQPDPYAALPYDPASADVTGLGAHGTHVADIAAGNGSAPGSAPGVAPAADLIFVHLRGEDTAPDDNLGDSVRLIEAARYVLDRAGDHPLVMNCSLGTTGGSHDWTPLVVRAFDALLEERSDFVLVMSGGNYGEAELHSRGRLAAGEQCDLRWRVVRGGSDAELEVWYPGGDQFEAVLIEPRGSVVARAKLGEDAIARTDGRVLASLFHRRRDPNNGDNHIDAFVWPDAPTGVWTVRLSGVAVADGSFNAYIERTSTREQSRFISSEAVPYGTTGSICNGLRTIAVGAYDAGDPLRRGVSSSSRGPSRDGRLKPDVSAPGWRIRAARSSRPLPDGSRRLDGTTIMSGTSMAAPHVSGVAALVLEAAAPARLDASAVKRILIETARGAPPNDARDRFRYGAGRVDAAAAVGLARSRRRAPSTDAHVADGAEMEAADAEPAEEYLPAGGRRYNPVAVAFRCAPAPPSVDPAGELPARAQDGAAVAAAALAALGAPGPPSAALAGLRPFGERFGTLALTELLRRLRYAPASLVSPPHTHGNRFRRRLGVATEAELLAPRLLLTIPGHFRELARRAPREAEAHALETLGWLLARSVRDDVRRATGHYWWLPPAPDWAQPFPSPLPQLSDEVTSLVVESLLIDTQLDPGAYQQSFRAWVDGPAGDAWRLETSGRAYAPEVAVATDVARERVPFDEAWAGRLARLDADPSTPALSDASTQALQACANADLPQGRTSPASLGGLTLVFDYPVHEPGGTVFHSLPVMAAIRPVCETLFATLHALGWNDLLFECAGATCFRGVKLPPSAAHPTRHHEAARRLSNHSYGLALDFNTFENGQNSSGSMDPRLVAFFEAFHFRWGRCFPVPDPMHFEYCGPRC